MSTFMKGFSHGVSEALRFFGGKPSPEALAKAAENLKKVLEAAVRAKG